MLITSHANLSVSGHRRQAIVVVIGSIPSSKPPLIRLLEITNRNLLSCC
ncbi:hypothetical protein MtrunA17_Chr3g0089701 [Medicago truncatula]|uniref:Uncharacterized protein n=1 Tax=Medicago truncatula TaxID=3880 RepID=A0A396IKT4_MEDTR|nr:hypothetical protein MtrunA17_Chr3g0089701 [Medicago truncatula]